MAIIREILPQAIFSCSPAKSIRNPTVHLSFISLYFTFIDVILPSELLKSKVHFILHVMLNELK